jgi:hypothetical protein
MVGEIRLNSPQPLTYPHCSTNTMNIKLFTRAFAVTLCFSGVLAADVFASQSDNNPSPKNQELQELAQYYQNDRNQNDLNYNNRSEYRKDRNNNNHPRSYSRLPNGYRKFVSRDKTYYTQDNQAYYSYSPASRAYVLVDQPDLNNNYPRSFSRLPNGYRKFVSHNKTYYTQDNQAYYSYSPASRAYVLINLPGFSIAF